MKKLFKTLTVLATALALGFGFASCKNNDDDSSSGAVAVATSKPPCNLSVWRLFFWGRSLSLRAHFVGRYPLS